MKHGKHTVKHSFLRRIVLLCLAMMVLLTLTVVVMAAVTWTQIDAGTLGVLMGGWCGELLLTLLKRRWEVLDNDDRQEAGEKEDNET